MKKLTIFWFRRDLRFEDNHGLYQALSASQNVQPLFIFDTDILSRLEERTDARVHFIHETLNKMKTELQENGSDLWIRHGKPIEVWKKILQDHPVEAVHANRDYEPSARFRDEKVRQLLQSKGIGFSLWKDQCLFETDEVMSSAGSPYVIYTPYKKKVLSLLSGQHLSSFPSQLSDKNFSTSSAEKMLSLKDLGFQRAPMKWPKGIIHSKLLKSYAKTRDFPALSHGTSQLGLHLRFGTIGIRKLASVAKALDADTYLSELIWRDFFMQILWNFPHVEKKSFRPIYDQIKWRNSRVDFQRWAHGETGYPWVDAGMRELNATGYMHNRVRMGVASFLSKHLLIHWSEGERYFAKKLLDYELSSNNGNWQWVAGSGCDAAPYFRVFNPVLQAKKFDPEGGYVQKWVPELRSAKYPKPMIDHEKARRRAISEYSKVLREKR